LQYSNLIDIYIKYYAVKFQIVYMQAELPDGKHITGTLVWYYFICKREVWLMGHEITPDEEQESLRVGRAIHEIYYRDLKSEVEFEGIKIDRIRNRVIYEIKTSSKYMESAKFQLLFYIYRLEQEGLKMKGELLIPRGKKNSGCVNERRG